MKRLMLFTMVIVLAVLLGCKQKSEPTATQLKKVTVTLDWTPNTNHTGLYVAKELGYFKAQGLEVSIVQPAQLSTDQIVATGKSEFGVSYQENVIRARSERLPLVSIAAIIQHNTSGFASVKSAGIVSPADFAGKRYGSWDSPSEMAILKAVCKKHKVDFDKIKVVSGVTDFFSTIGKDADFEWIYYGWDGIAAKNKGIEINYIPLRELDPILDYHTPVLITSESMLKGDTETVRKFIAATAQGYAYCISKPDSAAAILLKHAPELDRQLVINSQKYLTTQYQADAPRWGVQKQGVWNDFAMWMYEQRLINQAIVTSEAYTNDMLP